MIQTWVSDILRDREEALFLDLGLCLLFWISTFVIPLLVVINLLYLLRFRRSLFVLFRCLMEVGYPSFQKKIIEFIVCVYIYMYIYIDNIDKSLKYVSTIYCQEIFFFFYFWFKCSFSPKWIGYFVFKIFNIEIIYMRIFFYVYLKYDFIYCDFISIIFYTSLTRTYDSRYVWR